MARNIFCSSDTLILCFVWIVIHVPCTAVGLYIRWINTKFQHTWTLTKKKWIWEGFLLKWPHTWAFPCRNVYSITDSLLMSLEWTLRRGPDTTDIPGNGSYLPQLALCMQILIAFCIGRVEVYDLLRCYVASPDDLYPTFKDKEMVPSLRVSRMNIAMSEDTTSISLSFSLSIGRARIIG